MEYFIIVLLYLLSCVMWGVLTAKVISDKGYQKNWFWWGFFFGFIALVVAIIKPVYNPSIFSKTLQAQKNAKEKVILNQSLLENGGWKCTCGRVNAKYVTTCPCGQDQRGMSTR